MGDNITPPQQALGWILDIYDNDEALNSSGQTIIYALHQSIGHLGIFVSAKVATKEHEEFALTMDLIDALPPGLYEAVFVPKLSGWYMRNSLAATTSSGSRGPALTISARWVAMTWTMIDASPRLPTSRKPARASTNIREPAV